MGAASFGGGAMISLGTVTALGGTGGGGGWEPSEKDSPKGLYISTEKANYFVTWEPIGYSYAHAMVYKIVKYKMRSFLGLFGKVVEKEKKVFVWEESNLRTRHKSSVRVYTPIKLKEWFMEAIKEYEDFYAAWDKGE